MFGFRCQGCGEVRWSLLTPDPHAGLCPVCGEQMVEERRHPGRHAAASPDDDERRDAATAPVSSA